MMSEYDNILKQIEELPDVFGKVDIVDLARAELNLSARKQPSGDDHLVICISRTQEAREMISDLNWRMICTLTIMMLRSSTRCSPAWRRKRLCH